MGARAGEGGGSGTISGIITKSSGYVTVKYDDAMLKAYRSGRPYRA